MNGTVVYIYNISSCNWKIIVKKCYDNGFVV